MGIFKSRLIDQKLKIHVRALAPGAILFEGEALAVSSKNSVGKFDILPMHANFITIVENYPLVITKLDSSKLTFQVREAIIYNSDNKVSVYTDPKVGVKI